MRFASVSGRVAAMGLLCLNQRDRFLAWLLRLAALLLLCLAGAAQAQITFDSTSPTTTGGSVPAGGTLSAGINFTANSVAGDSIERIELYSHNGYINSGTYKVIFDSSGQPVNVTRSGVRSTSLGIGTHHLYLVAHSYNGEMAHSPTYTVTVTAQASPPGVGMSAPLNGVKFFASAGGTASVAVSGSASSGSASIVKIEVLDNGGVIKTVNAASISTSVALAVGSHSIQLRATDSLGQSATSTASAVTIEVPVPPSVGMSAPAHGANVTATAAGSASVAVSGNASAGSASVTKIEVLDNGSVIASVNGASISTSVALTVGSHNIQLRATDSLGSTATSSVAGVTVKAPVVPPSVNMSAPANGISVTSPASVPVSGSASAGSASVARIEVLDNGSVIASANGSSISTSVSLAVGSHS
ncbi:MAG TPA: Ig-like domain-containing protein, partial [Paucimonas sp.]|nr:Ig-like domain-containing protein [Paucimonas sp.]